MQILGILPNSNEQYGNILGFSSRANLFLHLATILCTSHREITGYEGTMVGTLAMTYYLPRQTIRSTILKPGKGNIQNQDCFTAEKHKIIGTQEKTKTSKQNKIIDHPEQNIKLWHRLPQKN